MTQKKWEICPPLPADLLAERSGFDPLLVQLLYNRGIEDPADFEAFIAGDERLANDPLLLSGTEMAVTRILRALVEGELVAVYGDFDADGITATALLVQGISRLGGGFTHYIPHRLAEGHGLNYPALKSLREQGVGLVVTVDCGITGFPEVEQTHELGLDIIITDHHVPAGPVPPALVAINPKLPDSAYPFYDLAGVGVAFKLLQALFRASHSDGECDEFLDLVALGTVADMVPLNGENRYFVKRGLEVLNESKRVGLQELVLRAGLDMGKLNAESISYTLGPRLNASGRLDHAITSYELLMTSSRDQAHDLASALEASNSERQRLTLEDFTGARERLLSEAAELPLLMVDSFDYRPGVMGVVAGKLAEEFYRPAVVLHLDGDVARGSARSASGFNMVAALSECQDLLTRFGGHAQAAGFVMPIAKVERLRQRLLEIAARDLAGVDFRPALTIDAVIPLSALGGETYKIISKLAPFGQDNQVPIFLSRKVEVVSSRTVGGSGDHLKLKLRDGHVVWDAIAFDLGDRQLTSHIDIVYNLETDDWSGRELLRLNVLDFLPAS
ncbi:MAG: single-stranded-DNA-specific exonuclease RecJ [Dehalococcoidia bacterium]